MGAGYDEVRVWRPIHPHDGIRMLRNEFNEGKSNHRSGIVGQDENQIHAENL